MLVRTVLGGNGHQVVLHAKHERAPGMHTAFLECWPFETINESCDAHLLGLRGVSCPGVVGHKPGGVALYLVQSLFLARSVRVGDGASVF